jgi:hypothetical protein
MFYLPLDVHSDTFSFSGLFQEFIIVDESVLMRIYVTVRLSVLLLASAGGSGAG